MKLLLVVLMVILSSISSYAQPDTINQLEQENSYQLEWIGESPLIDYSYLNVILDKNNRAYGLAGCNYWSTTYQLTGNELNFSPEIQVTKEKCTPALMEQEERFLNALATIIRWDFSELGQLRLWPKKGQALKLWQEKNIPEI